MSKLTHHSLFFMILCLSQILSWGGLYYSLSVLGQPISQEMGWPYSEIYQGLTLAILTAGFLSLSLGFVVSKLGTIRVINIGFLIGAVSFLILALAHNHVIYLLGWLIAGVAMAATLYDVVFLLVAEISPHPYEKRKRIA